MTCQTWKSGKAIRADPVTYTGRRDNIIYFDKKLIEKIYILM